jgi:hypothetical protein
MSSAKSFPSGDRAPHGMRVMRLVCVL